MICVNYKNMKTNQTAEAILIVLKTIGRWLLIAALILLAIFSVIYLYVKIDDYIRSRPRVIDEFLNIKLEEKLSDVLFRIEGLELDKEGIKVRDESTTRYTNKNSGVAVDVELGRVSGIVYKCKDDADYMVVNNIFCNDLGDKVLKKYDDVRILCTKETIKFRVYDAVKYGVRYYVVSNKVAAFYVAKPSYLETLVGINWDKCE
jgi:hypothetical protein